MARPLSVALLNPCYWPEVRRGSERFARELADGLLARGQRVTLITSHRGRPTRRVEDGMVVVRLPRPPDGYLRRRGFEDHMTHAPLSRVALGFGDYDLAHALFASDAVAAASWGRATARPVVYSHMGVPERADLLWRRRRLDLVLRATAGADATVALSRVAAEGFARELGVAAEVIHPGVDIATFAPGPSRAGVPTVLCAADPSTPRKRVALLVGAVARLRTEFAGLRLVLSRPARGRLAPEFQRHGDWLELRDLDDRNALANAYREAWVSALPSSGEAFGLVLAESLACGTPVVAADDRGMSEVVDESTIGTLVELGDAHSGEQPVEALAASLRGWLQSPPADPVAERCRRSAERFSTDRCAERYLDLYRRLDGTAG